MSVKIFVRREHEILAVCWTGANFAECEAFVNGYAAKMQPDEDGKVEIRLTSGLFTRKVAREGDWIVKDGEFVTVWTAEELAARTTERAWLAKPVEKSFADAKEVAE